VGGEESKSKSESESDSNSESKSRKGTGKGKGKGERERESTKVLAILFLNRLGQSENLRTILYCTGKSGIVCTVKNP
jgi:hypothetical protein